MDPRPAVDVVAFVPQHATEDLADAGPRTQQIQGVGVMVLGRFEEKEFPGAKQMLVVGEEREVDGATLVPR